MFKIASWNVNSLKVRMEYVLEWMVQADIDVLALQETKVPDASFPLQTLIDSGYHVAFSGEKTYNGVAFISKTPIESVIAENPHFEDTQKRVLVATIAGYRVVNLYVPNGAALDSDKYQYKLRWLDKMHAFLQEQKQTHNNIVVLGDFNIAPADQDVHAPEVWAGGILVSPAERTAFQDLLALGFKDSFRQHHPDTVAYSWWDYRMNAFRRNMGLRIDHILISDDLVDNCVQVGIEKELRSKERPSDHAPVWALFT
ncbi:MAG: exodeoxyribonuclease III [Legionellaceae bacterium]|nr:exodeoxyribonuclease III [Legionellaceae bacterium]